MLKEAGAIESMGSKVTAAVSQFLKRPLIRHIRKLLSAALLPGDEYLLKWWVNIDDVGEECWAYSSRGIHYFYAFDSLNFGVLSDINRHIREHGASEPEPWEEMGFGSLFQAIRLLMLKLRNPQMDQSSLYWLSRSSVFERPLRFIVRLSVRRWLDRLLWSSLAGTGVYLCLSFILGAKSFLISIGISLFVFSAIIVGSLIGRFILKWLAQLYIRLRQGRFEGAGLRCAGVRAISGSWRRIL